MHREVRPSSFFQQAAGHHFRDQGLGVPGDAVEHSVADPCKQCVLARGNGGPSQCDGGEHPSHGNLLPFAVAGTQATGSFLLFTQKHGSMSCRLADHILKGKILDDTYATIWHISTPISANAVYFESRLLLFTAIYKIVNFLNKVEVKLS